MNRFGGDDAADDDFGEAFRAFCARPENKPLVAEHQRQELRKLDRVHHRARAMEFRDAVLSADEEAQRNVAPFLRTRATRHVVETFGRDDAGDFSKWASNPMVIEMLSKCQSAIDEGRISNEDMERVMVNYLSDPKNDGHEKFRAATTRVASLEGKDLVGALNEQLQLRYEGNDLYAKGDFESAHERYEQALGIMNLVKGRSPADAYECEKNRRAVLANLGACCMAMKLYGEAVEHLNEALKIGDPNDSRLINRRGRAHLGRGEFALAKRDFERALALDPRDADALASMDACRAAFEADKRRQRAFSRNFVAKCGDDVDA